MLFRSEVIRILARNVQHIVGTFESSKHFAFVIPDDKKFGSDIFISKDNFNGARNGMKVLVEIITWPQKTRSAEGKVVQLIGYKDSPGVDILSIVRNEVGTNPTTPALLTQPSKIGNESTNCCNSFSLVKSATILI